MRNLRNSFQVKDGDVDDDFCGVFMDFIVFDILVNLFLEVY